MLNKIKRNLAIISTSVALLAVAVLPSMSAEAACGNVANNLQQGANATGGNATCGASGDLQSGARKLAGTITTDFSVVVGAVSVIMIIYAGFKYITSGGSNENTNSARNILMYAVIGIVIAVIAQLIVHLVINTATKING